MSGDPTNPGGTGGDGHAPPPSAPRTGEGASTALEALIRKRRQAERPDPPEGTPQQPPGA